MSTSSLAGFMIGELLVLSGPVNNEYECLCECGQTIHLTESSLRSKETKDCGCKSPVSQPITAPTPTIEALSDPITLEEPGPFVDSEGNLRIRAKDGSLREAVERICIDCGDKRVVIKRDSIGIRCPKCIGKLTTERWRNKRQEIVRETLVNGYIKENRPDHHIAMKANGKRKTWILQHRRVMDDHLMATVGRHLKPSETVHHLNGNRSDNRIENLEVWVGSHSAGIRLQQAIEQAIAILEENGYDVKKKKGHRGPCTDTLGNIECHHGRPGRVKRDPGEADQAANQASISASVAGRT